MAKNPIIYDNPVEVAKDYLVPVAGITTGGIATVLVSKFTSNMNPYLDAGIHAGLGIGSIALGGLSDNDTVEEFSHYAGATLIAFAFMKLLHRWVGLMPAIEGMGAYESLGMIPSPYTEPVEYFGDDHPALTNGLNTYSGPKMEDSGEFIDEHSGPVGTFGEGVGAFEESTFNPDFEYAY